MDTAHSFEVSGNEKLDTLTSSVTFLSLVECSVCLYHNVYLIIPVFVFCISAVDGVNKAIFPAVLWLCH